MPIWSRGRVARQSSAKAPTAVRIRSRPQQNNRSKHPQISGGVCFLKLVWNEFRYQGLKNEQWRSQVLICCFVISPPLRISEANPSTKKKSCESMRLIDFEAPPSGSAELIRYIFSSKYGLKNEHWHSQVLICCFVVSTTKIQRS
jgi:hypothetical protein